MSAPKTAWLLDALDNVQSGLQMSLSELDSLRARTTSSASTGTHPWVKLLRDWLPDEHGVTAGYVIDSHGEKSDRLDAIIFERRTTPLLLHGPHHRLIPVETTVCVVIPCGQMDQTGIDDAARLAATVKRLRRAWGRSPADSLRSRTASPVVAVVATRHEADLAPFEAVSRRTDSSEQEVIDCGVIPGQVAFDTFDRRVNMVHQERALIHFLFRLLYKLQPVGHLRGADWGAYAQVIAGMPVDNENSSLSPDDGYSTAC